MRSALLGTRFSTDCWVKLFEKITHKPIGKLAEKQETKAIIQVNLRNVRKGIIYQGGKQRKLYERKTVEEICW